MNLVIFYRENNEKHLIYHLNVTAYKDYKVGTYNSYDWLVLANLKLYYDGLFYNQQKYHTLLLKDREKRALDDRKRAKKIEKRNKLVEFLEVLKNGI